MPKRNYVQAFISYTHDSDSHKERVLALASRLRGDGIDVHLDQWVQAPEKGWPRWTSDQVEGADFVLIVCTEIYLRRFRLEEEQGKGLGASWESGVVVQELYEAQGVNTKFIPVLFSSVDDPHIPAPLRSTTCYVVDGPRGYEALYARLSGQSTVQKPPLGKPRKLQAHRPSSLFTNTDAIGASGTVGQVFISYRHVAPDEDLAHALAARLEERNHPVFIDARLEVGTRWSKEIERQIRASGFFVVLLSKHSVQSEMVRWEVELAHELEGLGKLQILPIRIDFDGELPSDLASTLDPIHYVRWSSSEAMDDVLDCLVAAIEKSAALPQRRADASDVLHLDSSDQAPDAGPAPLPAAESRLIMETGTVRLKSPFYVERAADRQMERALEEGGATLVVKGARQSGKSSLLARAHALARSQGRRSVYLDFQQFDDDQLESLDRLMRVLAKRVTRSLRAKTRVEEIWDEDFGAKENFVDFLSEILDESDEPILLILDEVDRVFERPYRGDFFAAVRGWHNRRALEPSWERLDLAIGHATDPTLWIDDLNQSPFNVGERLRLDDFNDGEVATLAALHGVSLGDGAETLRRLIGGQPYLMRQALYTLATEGWTVDQLWDVAADETGPFGDHLRGLLWKLRRNEQLFEAMKAAVKGDGCADEMDFQRLRAVGLVIVDQGNSRLAARPRYELYRRYFETHLL